MQILNEETFERKKYTVFVLTYLGLDYFLFWSDQLRLSKDVQVVLVDNGSQESINRIKDVPVYQTSQNIGCAGGWNLICQIAFDRLGLDKIIIAQDDSIIDENVVSSIWESTNDDVIVGAYDRSFEFAVFGITKNYWNEVGFFDENFIYGGCEDNDYKHRSKLANKKVISLNYSADMNQSLSSKLLGDQLKSSNEYNAEYIKQKWGEHYQFMYPFDDDRIPQNSMEIQAGLNLLYENPTEFPSILEYKSI